MPEKRTYPRTPRGAYGKIAMVSWHVSSKEARARIDAGQGLFYDEITKRLCEVVAYDFYDHCCAYAQIFDCMGTDYERLDTVDLSCLSAVQEGELIEIGGMKLK